MYFAQTAEKTISLSPCSGMTIAVFYQVSFTLGSSEQNSLVLRLRPSTGENKDTIKQSKGSGTSRDYTQDLGLV